jgi:hypothetical protein
MILLGAILALLVFGASGAGAATTFTDPAGDATGGAPDITQVVVSNDPAGNITFALTTNRSAFTDDDVVGILLDTDKNSSTGSTGVDYAIVLGNGLPVLLRGNGTGFERAPGTLIVSPNFMTVTVNRSDLGATTGFVFAVFSGLNSNNAAADDAPDNGGWSYDLQLAPVLDTLAAKFAPAKPKAGKAFKLAGTTLRLEDGTIVKGTITCVAKLNGKRLAGKCAWRIPKNARGKRLVVTLTAHYQGVTTTFTPWRFRVG